MTPKDMGDAIVQIAKLRLHLQVVLDNVDYTCHACEITEMVGAVLDRKVIERAKQALAETRPDEQKSTAQDQAS